MISEALKLAKLQRQQALEHDLLQLVKAAMSNPVVELVGAFVLVEALQRTPEGRPIIGNLQGNLLEASIGSIIGIQQLAPSLPYLAQAGGTVLESVGQVVKLGLMAGA